MLQYDMTNTLLAKCSGLVVVPTEGELEVIKTGLLLVDGLSFLDLRHRNLELSRDRCGPLAELISQRLTPFVRVFGSPDRMRKRLAELSGIRISRALL
jgi:hypothetical protein